MIYEVGERTDDRILPHQAREEYGASVMDGGDNIGVVVAVVTRCNAWTSGNVVMHGKLMPRFTHTFRAPPI